jgi:tetratricopeptide (TPR) repeat protein
MTLLSQIITDYPSSKAALRAEVELAKRERAKGERANAQTRLTRVLATTTTDKGRRAEIARAQFEQAWNPLLVSEAQRNYNAAITEFQKLAAYANDAERDEDGSSVVEKAQWQIAHCLLAQNQRTEAIAALRKFVTDHPTCYLSIRAQEKLEQLGAMRASAATNTRLVADVRPPDAACGAKALAAVLQTGKQGNWEIGK